MAGRQKMYLHGTYNHTTGEYIYRAHNRGRGRRFREAGVLNWSICVIEGVSCHIEDSCRGEFALRAPCALILL